MSNPSNEAGRTDGAPGSHRGRVRALLERGAVQHAILTLIIINAIILGLETSPRLMAEHGALLSALDKALLSVFVIEIAARLHAYRGAFLRDPWSNFDFALVGIALVPGSGPFAVLRALRVLRVLRNLTIVPSMRRVMGGLLAAQRHDAPPAYSSIMMSFVVPITVITLVVALLRSRAG